MLPLVGNTGSPGDVAVPFLETGGVDYMDLNTHIE